MSTPRTSLLTAALVLGVGFGGFVDGIVLHQLLQWHNMLSSVVPPTSLVAMKYNMIWDGVFHALTWTTCLVGVGLLFRAARSSSPWSGHLLAGGMVAGWGLFNAVEGVIDHLVLQIHHVHPGANERVWDLGFVLIGGIGLVLVGYVIARRPAR